MIGVCEWFYLWILIIINCCFAHCTMRYKTKRNWDTMNGWGVRSSLEIFLLSGDTLALLADQRLVDVRNDSSSSNGGLDQCVQLLVSWNNNFVKNISQENIWERLFQKYLSWIVKLFDAPLMASWRCLGVILFAFKSLEALPANSRTSAVRYSRIAEL